MLKLQLSNAAGTAKTIEHVRDFARSQALSSVLLGTIDYNPRVINEGKTFWPRTAERLRSAGMSLNSLGMPGGGLAGLRAMLRECCDVVKAAGKELHVSISGANVEQLMELAEVILQAATDCGVEITIEINLGCPNVWDGGKQKEIWSFNSDLILEAGAKVFSVVGKKLPIDLKLSPFSNPRDLAGAIQSVSKLHAAGVRVGVVYANTFPNCFLWDDPTDDDYANNKQTPAITTTPEGLAGAAGPMILAIIMGGLRQFQAKLHPDVRLTGAGGICDGWSLSQVLGLGITRAQTNSPIYVTEDVGQVSGMLEDFGARYPKFAEKFV